MGTTYTGTDQAETFTLEDNDIAFGNGGNDRFRASRSYIGNVTIHGGDGNDTVDPFNWSSVVAYGDAGNDVLAGGYVSNYLDGGDGDDTFSMTKGQYTIVGGNGNDLITIDLPTVPPEIRIPEWDPQHLAILENSSIYGDAGIDSVNITADVNAKSAIVQGINFFDLTITYLTNKLVTLRLFDIESVKLNSVSVWSLDTSPPTVTTFAPLDEATRVAIDSNIVLTFNEAIQRGSGNILLKTAAGTTVATYDASGSANLSISGNTLTINPTKDLGIFTGYKVEIAAGAVKDLTGNSYAGVNDYNFSTQTLDSLYHFCVVAFSAAPGEEFMNQMAIGYNAGMTVRDIVRVFTTKPQFTSTYSESLTNAELATLLVNNVVRNSASEATKIEGAIDIAFALDNGMTRWDMIYQVFGNLANMPLDDSQWGNTTLQFNKQTEVARYFTEAMHNTTTDMPTLRAVIGSVTAATDVSTPDVIAKLIGVELAAMH